MTKRHGGVISWGSRGLKSFTLVEILVSVAILSVFVILLMSMLGSLTTVWQEGQSHNERRTIAQTVFDRMGRDLSQTALPVSRTNTNELQMVINPSGVGASYQNPQAIFWQAPVATDGGTNGNMAIVGYFVQWVNGTPGTPCLSRLLINPSSTNYAVYTAPTAWISTTLLNTYAPAKFVSPSSANNYAGLLSPNVLGLWVQALDPRGNPIDQGLSAPDIKGEAFDSRNPYSYTDGSGNLATNIASALPASMQIAIAVIDSRTAKLLTTTGKPNYPTLTGNFWGDVQSFYNGLPSAIRKGTEIQTTTITLANGPR